MIETKDTKARIRVYKNIFVIPFETFQKSIIVNWSCKAGRKVLSWEQWQWWNWTGLFWRVSGRYFDSHHSVRPSPSHFCGLTDKYIGRVKICAPLYKHHGQNMRTSSCWCVVDIVHTFWGRQTHLSRFICRLFFALNDFITTYTYTKLHLLRAPKSNTFLLRFL